MLLLKSRCPWQRLCFPTTKKQHGSLHRGLPPVVPSACLPLRILFGGAHHFHSATEEGQTSLNLELIQMRRRIKTGVLFLSWNEPRNLEDAKAFFNESARRFYALPKWVSRLVSKFYLKLSGDVILNQRYFQPAKERNVPSLWDSSLAQTGKLKAALEHMMPEIGPLRFYLAYLACEKHSLEQAVIDIQEDCPEQVIIFPQYPHYWCYQTGSCVNAFCDTLKSLSVPAYLEPEQVREDRIVREIHRPNPGVLRQLCGNPRAYEVTPPVRWSLIDRWPTHPALTDAWARIISEEVRKFPQDVRQTLALVFCAPNRQLFGGAQYKLEVGASCLRIAEALRNKYPYRLAYFTGWDQWPGIDSVGLSSIVSSVRDLVRRGWKNILLVPLTQTVPNIDSEIVIPSHLKNDTLKRIGAHHVQVLSTPATHSTFVHGLAEIIKNHVLEGSPVVSTKQFSLKCPNCILSECQESRDMFVV